MRKYLPNFIKILEYLNFGRKRCCIVFLRKSQIIKYSKWRTKICKICLFLITNVLPLFENKLYFCNKRDRLTPKMYNHVRLSVNFKFKNLLPVSTKTSISIDLTDWFWWNVILRVMRKYSNVLWKNMTPYEQSLTIFSVTQKQM